MKTILSFLAPLLAVVALALAIGGCTSDQTSKAADRLERLEQRVDTVAATAQAAASATASVPGVGQAAGTAAAVATGAAGLLHLLVGALRKNGQTPPPKQELA